eukprot:scaffold10772_cov107-Isochrysis_galbana.AAC.2
MGDPSRYPEIRLARHMYALQWLPREVRDDRPLLQQWIDNNMSYLDACAIVVFQDGDADFRRDSWSIYHNLHMCRLGVCPNWLWCHIVVTLVLSRELFSFSCLWVERGQLQFEKAQDPEGQSGWVSSDS